MKWILGSAPLLAMAAAMLGCSIHTQAPIKEIAYDFSDRDFYDRSYAASPDYSEPEAVAAVDDSHRTCPLAASCQTGACGCGHVHVEHHHYYEDTDSSERAPRRHSRPRAEIDQDDEDSRQAERPARPRVRVEVEAQDVGQAPANRSTGPARPDSPAIGSAPRRAQVDVHSTDPARPDSPAVGSAPRRAQVDVH